MNTAFTPGLQPRQISGATQPPRLSSFDVALATLVNLKICTPAELKALLVEIGRIAVDVDSGHVPYVGMLPVIEHIDMAADGMDAVKEFDPTCRECQGTGEGRNEHSACGACRGRAWIARQQ